MYESFYKLKKMPFGHLVDLEFYFMSDNHQRIYSQLENAVKETKEFVAITGESGSGKTTLINYFLSEPHQDIKLACIDDLYGPIDRLTQRICQECKLDVKGKSNVGILDFFHGYLLKQYEIEERTVLIINDAHHLTLEAMEEIATIADLEPEEPHLIQVIMVGRPELNYMLGRKSLEALANRITLRCHLGGLDMADTAKYIRHRLNAAGAENPDIFDEDSMQAVHDYSKGLPYFINALCDTALAKGFEQKVNHIKRTTIEDIVKYNKELGLFPGTAYEKESCETKRPPSNGDGKINRLTDLAEGIDKKLDALLKRKDSRDVTILELNKMLIDSLKRHGNTLRQFRDFKQKTKQKNSDNTR